MKTFNPIYNDDRILTEILISEEKDILQRVDPPSGIAWNSALLENVFAAFHGINNKVPVYICGKPGCSKSLAIQLIYSSMRGENSKDPYFKTLPRLFMNCYQGSTTSKSSGIINVFKKARNLIKGNSSDSSSYNNNERDSENISNARNVKKINFSLNAAQAQERVISLVFFDEMGLAEISKNNPLKVLHSELEPELECDKVAFVGISNWKLDASKSNRGIFIGRPDLDEEDLIITAKTIAESYKKSELKLNNNTNNKNKTNLITFSNNAINISEILNIKEIQITGLLKENCLSKYHEVFEALAKAYFHYKKQVANEDPQRDGFHGTRDFYYMIKYISKRIINAKEFLDEWEISHFIEESINRNFSGYKNSLNIFKLNFAKFYDAAKYMEINQTKAIRAIESNLADADSRYLMIIGQSQVSVNLLQNIITNFNLNCNNKLNENKQQQGNDSKSYYDKQDYCEAANNFNFMIGSQFENDIESNDEKSNEYNEEYSFKTLNKIQVYMEQGNIMILSGLSSIYPSLYDLFNQNFSVVGGKKYARIALGTSNNPMAYVHGNFKCIIILSEDELEKQDPPFLNRFEKAVITFESLL